MKMIPFNGIEGAVKFWDNGYWLYEVDILSRAIPENGSFTRQVWARNPVQARGMMSETFKPDRWTLGVQATRVHIDLEVWKQLVAEKRRQIKPQSRATSPQ